MRTYSRAKRNQPKKIFTDSVPPYAVINYYLKTQWKNAIRDHLVGFGILIRRINEEKNSYDWVTERQCSLHSYALCTG